MLGLSGAVTLTPPLWLHGVIMEKFYNSVVALSK